MKPTSKELLEAVSKHCYNELTLYKFNNTTLDVSEKYREGRLTALEYLTEITYYYLQEEKKIEEDHHPCLRAEKLANCGGGDRFRPPP